jgi:hypothetical protein
MSNKRAEILAQFEDAARQAHMAEENFAKEFDAELARRRRERTFAYRRLGLMKELSAAALAAPTAEAAVTAQLDCLCREVGWHEVTPAKNIILEHFKPVAQSIRAHCTGEDAESCAIPGAAFANFEKWHLAETGSAFLALLDHEIPEMPLVDF